MSSPARPGAVIAKLVSDMADRGADGQDAEFCVPMIKAGGQNREFCVPTTTDDGQDREFCVILC